MPVRLLFVCIAAISVVHFDNVNAQTAQHTRVAQEMGMIVVASTLCGYPLSDDFSKALVTARTWRREFAYEQNFEAGKRTAEASALLGRGLFCTASCIAHGPKRGGGSGAFRFCK